MLKRRDFLKLTGGSVVAYSLPMSLEADDDLSGYKALIVVKLAGGNDALNMFIPSDANSAIHTGYGTYAKARNDMLRVKNVDLSGSLGADASLSLSESSNNPYHDSGSLEKAYIKGFYRHTNANFAGKIATNALMPELAHLINQGKGAIVHNIGNIIRQGSKAALKSGQVPIPTAYSSHVDGMHYVDAGEASQVTFATGWLGRLADNWQGVNGDSLYKLNINLSRFGSSMMLFGHQSSTLNLSYSNPLRFNGYDRESQKEAYDKILELSRRDVFKTLFNQSRKAAFLETETTYADWQNVSGLNDPFASLTNAYGKALFDKPNSSDLGVDKVVYTNFIEHFEGAARMVAIGQQKGLKRQVIMITLPSWDTHTDQAVFHARNIRGLSMGIGAFQTAIESLDLAENVTMFSVSEFARTTATNSSGTDHGWGGSQMVIGGAVKGGSYGEMPDLRIGGEDDISLKGRVIPKVAFTQYYGTIAKWFGADSATLAKILPELKNFETKDLGFMK